MLGLVWGGDGGFEGGPGEGVPAPVGGDWPVVALFTLFVMLVLPTALFCQWRDSFDRPPRSSFVMRKD